MRGAVVGGGAIAATGGTVSALAFAGAPWWAIASIAAVFVMVGAAVALAQTFIPQDSRDRLEWWRDRRNHQARLRRSARRVITPANKS